MVCYLCRELGYFPRDCPSQESKHKAKPTCTESHLDAETDEFEGAFGVSSQSLNSEDWIIDSGASSHMTQSRQLLVDYEECDKLQKVCLGDGYTVEAFGRGNINLEWFSR